MEASQPQPASHGAAILQDTETAGASATAPARRPFAPVLALAVLAVALALYFPTLRASWAYDDMDYFNLVGDVLAGQRGFWEVVFRPHAEHFVAILRLVFHASVTLFGAEALPFRLLVLAAHAAAGFFLGLAARRLSGSNAAGLVTGLAYVASAGFSSMWVWFPTAAGVPLGIAFLTGALAILVHRSRLGVRRSRLLAGLGVLLTLACESTLAPLAAIPMLLDEYERRREGARRPVGAFSVFCVVAAAALTLLSAYLYSRTYGPRFSISFRYGIPRAAFLLLVAPFRLFFPGISISAPDAGAKTAVLGSVLGLAIALPVAALLLALWRRGAPRLAQVAALSAVGPFGVVGLSGLGRWRTSYWELYDGDRYFFTLLIPISLLAGAVAATAWGRLRSWPRRPRAALLLLVLLAAGCELGLHRRALLNRIPFNVYAAHEKRLEQLSLLGDRLEAAARALPAGAPPLEFPDADLWFPEVHNGRISTRVLIHALSDRAGGRLRLGGPSVGERDTRVLNPVLLAWAREIGEPLPYLSVVDGKLVDAHVLRWADFRVDPQDRAVVRGFYDWEGTCRWMGKEGELRLNLISPRLAFLFAVPREAIQKDSRPWPLAVQVTAVDEATGWPAPLGTIRVEREGLQVYQLDATPFLRRLGTGRIVHLLLTSDRTWRPVDLLPGSGDTRELSVMVQAAGCE